MSEEMRHTVCQACQSHCTLLATVEDGVVTALHGDKDDPAFHGYSCIKGREMGFAHGVPTRLLHSMRRNADGGFEPVPRATAHREIAGRLRAILDAHGPRSVAMFIGTYGYCNFPAQTFGLALMRAIGSPMIFSPQTIDQPGKGIAAGLHGVWLAGNPPMAEWEALLLIGTNPLVSMNGGLGPNPARTLKAARGHGMKLVVIDPRVTESARAADLHIQPRPGEDAAILAGIARELIVRGLIDHDFVASEGIGLDRLRDAVDPYTPDFVAARAGIPAAQIVEAATILGGARVGAVSAGTGANMSGESAVCEFFVRALTTLRGWWVRAGQQQPNPGVLIEALPPIAASSGSTPAFGIGEKLRVRGLSGTNMNLPTAGLAEEILEPGEGQVRALFVVGGNPVAAWPDQIRTDEAMRSLDLLVCLDPRMTLTARHADYVLAPKMQLEVETNSAFGEHCGTGGLAGWGFEMPYGVVCPPVVAPPARSDLEEEWEAFYGIAQALGVRLRVRSLAILDPARAQAAETVLDMARKPTVAEAWAATLAGSPMDYATVAARGRGALYPRDTLVADRPADWPGRLDLAPDPIVEDLATIAARAPGNEEFPFRLISRRMNDFHNSNWRESPRQRRKWAYNPAFMNPADLAACGVGDGDLIAIRSARATVFGIAAAEIGLRRGCVSISHAWGGGPEEPENPFRDGTSTARLSFTDRDFDRYSGIPLMSAIPVAVRALTTEEKARLQTDG